MLLGQTPCHQYEPVGVVDVLRINTFIVEMYGGSVREVCSGYTTTIPSASLIPDYDVSTSLFSFSLLVET